jgi:hypothetical protein
MEECNYLVVRHDRGAQNPERDVEHLGVADDSGGGDEAGEHATERGPRQPELHGERPGNAQNQQHDQHLHVPEPVLLEVQHDEHVEGRERHADEQREAEEQVQGDRGAEHFGEVGGGDGELREQPQGQRHRPRVRVAARLRQIAPGRNPEPRRHGLKQDRHEVRDHDDAQQRITVAGAARDVGRPVAGVHVPDRHEVAGPRKGQQLAPEAGGQRHRHRAVHFRQAGGTIGGTTIDD